MIALIVDVKRSNLRNYIRGCCFLALFVFGTYFPLVGIQRSEPEPELLLYTIEDIQYPPELEETLHYNASFLLGNFTFPPFSPPENTLLINYWVDIQIVYDHFALCWLIAKGFQPSSLCSHTGYGLNFGFQQYWSDMSFYTNNLPGYLNYDPQGPGSSDPTTILRTWPTRFGWSDSTSHRGPPIPFGWPGHGYYLDLLVMFLVDPSIDAIGWTWRNHNVVIINLWWVINFNFWNCWPTIGYWSVILHEVGHDYGCKGDTYGEHLDVMDYIYGLWIPYSYSFDSFHQVIIGPNRGLHSD